VNVISNKDVHNYIIIMHIFITCTLSSFYSGCTELQSVNLFNNEPVYVYIH